jgi:hypothetical protein
LRLERARRAMERQGGCDVFPNFAPPALARVERSPRAFPDCLRVWRADAHDTDGHGTIAKPGGITIATSITNAKPFGSGHQPITACSADVDLGLAFRKPTGSREPGGRRAGDPRLLPGDQ